MADHAHRVRTPRPPVVTPDPRGTVASALRGKLPGRSWSDVRRLCETGKVRLNGSVVLDPSVRIAADADLVIEMTAPRPRPVIEGFGIAFEDGHLIVIEKPAGVSSVPFERKETGTALDLIRDHWRGRRRKGATLTPLYTVHRLDKETSGLLCFAKTRAAERGLHQIFQRHLASRIYLAVAHGRVTGGRIESSLLADRGDGLRGSARGARDATDGQRAVTNVEVVEHFPAATLCRVRLETGRTHQIRIHLAESGHPVVGDAVYTRDLLTSGGRALPSERMLLHATTLGFDHPITAERVDLAAEPPPDFERSLVRLKTMPRSP